MATRSHNATCAAATLLGLWLALAAPRAIAAEPGAPLVHTAEGPVQGFVHNNVSTFLGIPYAAPPMGAQRWQPPQPVAAWTRTLHATQFANTCPQITELGVFAGPVSVTEDCLYLNVFTPHNGNAKKLAEEIGYHYRYDRRQDQYAHPAAVMVLTPAGKIARYLYGVRFRSRDLRFALTEASEGRMTLTVEKILLFCYHYDPNANRYVLFASNLMKGGGVITVCILAFFIWRMFKAEKLRAAHAGVHGVHREGTV